MEYLVSIIVPVYNKEKSLEKSIRSLQNQTYRNIEIILVNDGSTDKSKDICNKISSTDNRIKVIHKQNEGVSIARNVGISVANGDYISFVDPDDWVNINYIEELIKISLMEDSDIVSCCAMVVFNNETKEKNSFFQIKYGEIKKTRRIAQLLSNEYYNDSDKYVNIGVPWGKLYKLDFLKKNNLLFKDSLRRNQDNIFNLYAFQYANKLIYSDKPLYYYDYDHMTNFNANITNDAVELYTDLATETYNFYLKFYSNDDLIYELTKNKILKLLTWIFSKKVCHKKYKVNLKTRLKEIKNVSMSSPFNEVLNDKKKIKLYSKNKIIHYLLNIRAYLPLYWIFIIQQDYVKNK